MLKELLIKKIIENYNNIILRTLNVICLVNSLLNKRSDDHYRIHHVRFKYAFIITIYLSKLIVMLFIGKLILKKGKKLVLPLILGIIIYIILVSIPFIGWIVKLLAILLGLGSITLWVPKFLIKFMNFIF